MLYKSKQHAPQIKQQFVFDSKNIDREDQFQLLGWLRGTVVERWSLTGHLSQSCARPAADG